jgi:hypothetical protein
MLGMNRVIFARFKANIIKKVHQWRTLFKTYVKNFSLL